MEKDASCQPLASIHGHVDYLHACIARVHTHIHRYTHTRAHVVQIQNYNFIARKHNGQAHHSSEYSGIIGARCLKHLHGVL